MSEDRDWLQRGELVAVIKDGPGYRTVTINKVDRLTKTQVVLDDGRKFQRAGLYLIGESGYTMTYLASARDPRVANHVALRAVEEAARRIGRLSLSWVTDVASAQKALDCFDEQIAIARRRLDNLPNIGS